MATILEIAEGIQYQGPTERIGYQITTTNWVSSPTVSAVTAYDETTGDTDVTSSGGSTGNGIFPANSPGDSGNVISLSLCRDLIKGHRYRIEIPFTSGGNSWVCRLLVQCD